MSHGSASDPPTDPNPNPDPDMNPDPFALLSATLTAIDPALLSRSTTPSPSPAPSTSPTSTTSSPSSPPIPWPDSPPPLSQTPGTTPSPSVYASAHALSQPAPSSSAASHSPRGASSRQSQAPTPAQPTQQRQRQRHQRSDPPAQLPHLRLRRAAESDKRRHHPYSRSPHPPMQAPKRHPPRSVPSSTPCGDGSPIRTTRDERVEPEGGGEGHGLPGLGPGESSRLGVRGGESVRVGKQGDGGDEVSAFERHDAQTTLALSVGVFVERMVGVGMEMRAFLEEGFSASDRGGDVDARVGLENLRLGARRENRAVTELEEMLMPMPLSLEGGESGRVEGVVPRTGWEVRGLDHERMGALLDLYDLPFVPSMFLAEKKVLWLRFVGAGRALMHRVLD